MKWYYMAGPGGTICCKVDCEGQAKAEAAERWGCESDEISVTGEEEYHGSDWSPHGAHCAPLQAGRLPALQKKSAAADGQDP